MRVLFVAALPPERSSMIGRILPLAAETRAAGHDTEVLTLSGRTKPPYVAAEETEGVRLRTVGPALRATEISRPSFRTTLTRFLAGRAALTRALLRTPADTVVLAKPQFQNTQAVLAAMRSRRVPLLLDVDDREAYASRVPPFLRWYASALETRAGQHADAVTAASPALAAHMRMVNPAARVSLLPTGIRIPASLPPARLRERLNIPREERVILYVGSLSLSSGHRVDTLISQFSVLHSHFPDIRLVLAGDGVDAQRLRTVAHALRPKPHTVRFLGRFRPPEDLALAAEADLLVDPVDRSPANEAKSSHRTMLALATGTPIVTGNVGIRPFLLPTSLHARCLYNPDTPSELPTALARALDPGFRAQFQKETAGLVNQWTWPTLGKQFVTLLESLAHT